MKKYLLLNAFLLLLAGLTWSCNNDEMKAIDEMSNFLEDKFILTNVDIYQNYIPIDTTIFPLLNNQGKELGFLLVSNSENKMNVEYQSNDSYSISEVQLWVGTNFSDAPLNKKQVPLPGKFTYKASSLEKYNFLIDLSDIYQFPSILLEGKTIFLLAHATFSDNNTGKEESLWSEGVNFGTQRWGSYSEFHCFHPSPKMGGCYPHTGYCGIKKDGEFYYDNIQGGKQKIFADVEEVVGTIENQNGNFMFDFDQDWMFSGAIPEIVVYGFTDLNSMGVPLHSGAPSRTTDWPIYYYVTLDPYCYYTFELQLQYCTTR